MTKEKYVGRFTEIIDQTGLVELESYEGDGEWKTHIFPQRIFEGHVEIELGNVAVAEASSFSHFTTMRGRAPTPKERQYIKQRSAEAKAEMMKDLKEIEGAFSPPDSL